MIAFASCIADDAKFRRHVVPGLQLVAEPDALIIEASAEESIFGAYNEVLDAVADREDLEALVLLHEDVEITDSQFCAKLRAQLADPDVAIVGVIGARGVSGLEWWAADPRGYVVETRGAADFGRGVHEVECVDGLLLILSSWAVRNLRFDEQRFSGFHAYDLDICFQARAAGRKVVVADLLVTHHTKGGYGDRAEFAQADGLWRAKWTSSRFTEAAAPAAPTEPAHPEASIVLVTRGEQAATDRCVESLERALGDRLATRFELVLADDQSLSVAARCNAAAGVASGEVLIFLTDELVVEPGVIEALAETARVPGVGAVGARLLHRDGTIAHAGIALLDNGQGVILPHHIFHHDAGDHPAAAATFDVSAVTDACLATPRGLFTAVGGFDERYDDGWKDVDMCLRLRAAGKRVVYRGDLCLVRDEERVDGAARIGTEDVKTFCARWHGELRTESSDLGWTFDAGVPPTVLRAPPEHPHGGGARLLIVGPVSGITDGAAETRALLGACAGADLEPAVRESVRSIVGPRTQIEEWQEILEAQQRPISPDAITIEVAPHRPWRGDPLQPPAVLRLAELPSCQSHEATRIWAASPTLADALVNSGIAARRIEVVGPLIHASELGDGGGGLLLVLPGHDPKRCRAVLRAVSGLPREITVTLLPTLLTPQLAHLFESLAPAARLLGPCSDEARYAIFAGGADVVLCADPSDRFGRRALVAAATGTHPLTLAAGPADAILGDAVLTSPEALPSALEQAFENAGNRAARAARVASECGPAAVVERIRALMAGGGPKLSVRRAAPAYRR